MTAPTTKVDSLDVRDGVPSPISNGTWSSAFQRLVGPPRPERFSDDLAAHHLHPASCRALAIAAGTLFLLPVPARVTVTKQLRDEKITLPGNAPILAGKRVQDPVTAYVEALVIKGHAERGAGGRTYADISEALRAMDGASDEARKLRDQSSALSTAASLRTSLLTSVLAYGVSALVGGLGVLFLTLGSQLSRVRGK